MKDQVGWLYPAWSFYSFIQPFTSNKGLFYNPIGNAWKMPRKPNSWHHDFGDHHHPSRMVRQLNDLPGYFISRKSQNTWGMDARLSFRSTVHIKLGFHRPRVDSRNMNPPYTHFPAQGIRETPHSIFCRCINAVSGHRH